MEQQNSKKEKSATLPRQNLMTWHRGATRKALLYLMHVHKEVWEASFGEALMCEREPDNASDGYTIAVIGKSIPDGEIVTNRARYC